MQHGCHTIKNSQKKLNCQNFNVFKMQQGSILTLFVFHKAFQKRRDTSQRGHILFCISLVPPSRGQTSVTTKATGEGRAVLLCVSSARRALQGAGSCGPTPQGRQGWRKGQFTLWLTTECQPEFRGLAVKRQNTRILLEIRKGKKVNCVPRDSQLLVSKAPLKTHHKSHAADLHCCAGICPPPILQLATSVPFPTAPHNTHFPVPSTQLFPLPSPFPPLLVLWLQILFLHLCLPYFTHYLAPHSPILSLFSSIHNFLTLLSIVHPTSPPPKQPRGVENRGK